MIALSKKEQDLLSKLRPWKFLKHAVREDYEKMIGKINDSRLRTFQIIQMRNRWKDPSSTYNTLEYRNKLKAPRPNTSTAMRLLWKNPDFRSRMTQKIRELKRTDEWRTFVSKHFSRLWSDPEYRAKMSLANSEAQYRFHGKAGAREISVNRAKKAWITRKERYGESGFTGKPRKQRFKTERDKARLGERVRWGYAWKRLAVMFDMLYSPQRS